MKRILFVSLLFVTLLSIGCSQEDPVMIKQETNETEPSHKPEFVEEKNEDNETHAFIEFSLPEEQVKLNLKMIPILNQYLQTVQDRDQTIKEMNLIPVHPDYDTLYLLEFSCYDQSCSYILIDQSKDNRSHLIADLSQYIQIQFSPNMKKLFLQFNRVKDDTMSLGHIVVVDLQDWELLKPVEQSPPILHYEHALLEVDWEDDERIAVVVPDFSKLAEASTESWNEADNPTESVILKFD